MAARGSKLGFELLPPSRASRERLLSKAEKLSHLVDFISLPDTPAGIERVCSLAAAALISERLGVDVIIYIKTINCNRVALKSLVLGAALVGASGVLLMRGDMPSEGEPVRDVNVDYVVKWIRSRTDLSGLRVGVTVPIPLKKAEKTLRRRLSLNPDFVYTQVVTSPREVDSTVDSVRELSPTVDLVLPVVVPSPANEAALSPLGLKPARDLYRVVERAFERGVSVLLSSPADFEAAVRALKDLRAAFFGG